MNTFLLTGAILSAIASMLHIGCIVFGGPWYRFFGAGEGMATLAEQGSLHPSLITAFIAVVLAIWSLYAFSGSGLIGQLPLLRLGLCVITVIYTIRGIVGFFFIVNPIGRSPQFWLWSSLICSAIGIIHLIGLNQVWNVLN